METVEKYSAYEKLLKSFSSLPSKAPEDESFISICGYPHYERVASSITAFFLDTTREHRLKDLFVKSLIEAAGLNPCAYPNDYMAETEVRTTKGNFIDILLRNDQRNIVIENKIFAYLYNDLDDYYRTASEKNKESPLGIVLSLQPLEICNQKFRGVTYTSLFEQVKKNMGFYLQDCNSRYTPFLLDYMNNIESLLKEEVMDKELIEFMEEHEKEVFELSGKINDVRNDLRRRVDTVISFLTSKIQGEDTSIYHWRESSVFCDDAVVDYFPDNDRKLVIAFDSYIELKGWSFNLWIRSNKTGRDVKLEDLAKAINQDGTYNMNSAYVLNQKFPFDMPLEDIAEFSASVIQKLKDSSSQWK